MGVQTVIRSSFVVFVRSPSRPKEGKGPRPPSSGLVYMRDQTALFFSFAVLARVLVPQRCACCNGPHGSCICACPCSDPKNCALSFHRAVSSGFLLEILAIWFGRGLTGIAGAPAVFASPGFFRPTAKQPQTPRQVFLGNMPGDS